MSTTDLFSRTFAAVIFDNDGTLVDSTRAAQRSWVQWALEHGVDPHRLEGHHGMPASAVIASVAPHLDPVVALARIEELEVGDVAGVVPLPGASDALSALTTATDGPARHTIATSATRDLARARLREAGIAAPAGLVAVEDVERGKPDPEPFLLAARRLGVDPNDALVCEDAPSGIAAARAAGCAVLAVATTARPEELADADLVVESLARVGFELDGPRVRLTRR